MSSWGLALLSRCLAGGRLAGDTRLLLAVALATPCSVGPVHAAIRRLFLAGMVTRGRFHRYFLVQGVLDSALALASAVSTTACTL